ncbi:hypothetical protein HHO41_16190 [Bacillus sp. DNRA2]|uniref:YqgU-like beta propeller domain-containing protein n=1 Tax=Bacillus sp. DNRA2 TaxID=2723053 RepID=UPI00145ED432|nr:hypothetical protein [Bacillus sp. DNRA2]NMD71839.1 hypothetical protein [Bacillus sp. DNRA2]
MDCRCRKSLPYFVGIFLIFLSISLLAACNNEKSASSDKAKKSARRETTYTKASIQAPLQIAEGEFSKVVGWLNDETIVYITNTNQNSNVYTYHLLSGKQEKIFESKLPIISAFISPARDKILLHASSGLTEGSITVIDQTGTKLVEKSITSTELNFVWNPYDENLLLVTAFNEQWEYNVSLLNIETKKLTEMKFINQPFVNWNAKNEVIYLNWDLNNPSFFAPLVKQKINGAKEETLDLENVFQIYAYRNCLLTIEVDEKTPDQSVYTFLSEDSKPIASFSIPHLTRFSDWLVPEHTFNQARNEFYTLRPKSSGAADTYREGFQLVRYQLDRNNGEELLLDGLENKPISVSPAGEFCLYGHQLENIIILDTKELVSLVVDK